MESLACAVNGRQFQQLLVGISKRLFYDGENEFTHADLATQCYAGIELQPEDIHSQIIAYEQILSKAAEYNWDVASLEDKLRRLTDISADHLKGLLHFWNNEREKIHKQKVKESRWNNGYKNLLWRVDVEAISKDSAESGEPIALFEFVTAKQVGKSETQETAKFSMNRRQVNDMLKSLESIQKKLDESSY